MREAVAARIVSIVHCDTKYNLADMGTKALNGQVHQFLLKNQNFPLVSTAGECQADLEKPPVSEKVTKVKLLFGLLSPMDREMVKTLEDRNFQEYLLRMANKYEN